MTSCWVWRSYRVCWCQTVTCASCLLPPENWYRSVYQGVNNKCIDKSADRITLFCSDPMTTTPGLDADPKIATWHNNMGLSVLWRINTLKWPASRAETHSASVHVSVWLKYWSDFIYFLILVLVGSVAGTPAVCQRSVIIRFYVSLNDPPRKSFFLWLSEWRTLVCWWPCNICVPVFSWRQMFFSHTNI